mmetsp:Transcript_25597/g.46350  ORF Transcript_25597/g.46350 Transcript_25597/m.46350 type:complete len:264 (-) Transcript_25597:859-1650(-)
MTWKWRESSAIDLLHPPCRAWTTTMTTDHTFIPLREPVRWDRVSPTPGKAGPALDLIHMTGPSNPDSRANEIHLPSRRHYPGLWTISLPMMRPMPMIPVFTFYPRMTTRTRDRSIYVGNVPGGDRSCSQRHLTTSLTWLNTTVKPSAFSSSPFPSPSQPLSGPFLRPFQWPSFQISLVPMLSLPTPLQTLSLELQAKYVEELLSQKQPSVPMPLEPAITFWPDNTCSWQLLFTLFVRFLLSSFGIITSRQFCYGWTLIHRLRN